MYLERYDECTLQCPAEASPRAAMQGHQPSAIGQPSKLTGGRAVEPARQRQQHQHPPAAEANAAAATLPSPSLATSVEPTVDNSQPDKLQPTAGQLYNRVLRCAVPACASSVRECARGSTGRGVCLFPRPPAPGHPLCAGSAVGGCVGAATAAAQSGPVLPRPWTPAGDEYDMGNHGLLGWWGPGPGQASAGPSASPVAWLAGLHHAALASRPKPTQANPSRCSYLASVAMDHLLLCSSLFPPRAAARA